MNRSTCSDCLSLVNGGELYWLKLPSWNSYWKINDISKPLLLCQQLRLFCVSLADRKVGFTRRLLSIYGVSYAIHGDSGA